MLSGQIHYHESLTCLPDNNITLFWYSNKAGKFALQHEKTYLLTCATNEDSNQPVHLHSMISVHCVNYETASLAIQNAPSEDSDQTV